MSMIQYNPYQPTFRNNNFNDLFDSLFSPYKESENTTSHDWSPAVDIQEQPDSYVIYADVPGVNPSAIDISLADDVLTIAGKRQTGSKENKDNYKRTERVRGAFVRHFNLPDTADQANISADCKDGVLQVIIKKQDKVLPRKIAVNH